MSLRSLYNCKDLINHICEFLEIDLIIKVLNQDYIYILDRVISSKDILNLSKNYFENYIIGQNILFLPANKIQYLRYKIKESKCISPKILFTINPKISS